MISNLMSSWGELLAFEEKISDYICTMTPSSPNGHCLQYRIFFLGQVIHILLISGEKKTKISFSKVRAILLRSDQDNWREIKRDNKSVDKIFKCLSGGKENSKNIWKFEKNLFTKLGHILVRSSSLQIKKSNELQRMFWKCKRSHKWVQRIKWICWEFNQNLKDRAK